MYMSQTCHSDDVLESEMHVSGDSGVLLRMKPEVQNFIRKYRHNLMVHGYSQSFGLLDLLTTYLSYYKQL
jgi:hypothetical protein